ncbi:hypothetical protein CEN49_23450 [Fischerella thermalis CCMEE 5273]|nr:hypothetical protein CEN49_23450 [Fischerella thermalis CCMEE 5273]
MILVCAGLLLLSGCSLPLVEKLGKQSEEQADQEKRAMVERPGYEDVSVGDPAALVFKPGGDTVTYKGEPVVQACNLLMVDQVQKILLKTNLRIQPSSSGSVKRAYFDGKGLGDVQYWKNMLLSEENSCSYLLQQKPRESQQIPTESVHLIQLRVYLSSYVNPNIIKSELDAEYGSGEEQGEVLIYKRTTKSESDKNRDTAEYMLEYKGVFANLQLKFDGNDAAKEQLLQTVAKRLVEVVTQPEGPVKMAYASPIFTAKVGNGCEWTDNNDFKTVFGVDASASVKESVATAIGGIDFVDIDETKSVDNEEVAEHTTIYHYLEHQCTRMAVDRSKGGSFAKVMNLYIHTYTFETDEPARLFLEKEKGRKQYDPQPLEETIGDGAVYLSGDAGFNLGIAQMVMFRNGRFVVKVSFDDRMEEIPDAEVIERLLLVVKNMDKKMEGF